MRSIWSGSITFGMVSIPIKLYPAAVKQSVAFKQLEAATNTPIAMPKSSRVTGEPLTPDQIVKGYEVSKDSYVIVTPDELAAIQPSTAKTIEVSAIVEADQIPLNIGAKAYYIAPDAVGKKAYALFAQALQGRAAIARFVMRSNEYLVSITSAEGILTATQLFYADETRDPTEVPTLHDIASVEVSDAELDMAGQLLDSMTVKFEHDDYTDQYREDVLALIEAKGAGAILTSVSTGTAPAPVDTVGLMAALAESVANAGKKKPAAKKAVAKKAPAKRASRKKVA